MMKRGEKETFTQFHVRSIRAEQYAEGYRDGGDGSEPKANPYLNDGETL